MPAWSSIWDSVKSGNIRQAGNYVFLSQEDVDTSNAADSRLEEIVRNRLGDGKITDVQAMQTYKNIQQNALPEVFDNPELSPLTAFQDGALEGLANDMTLARKGLSTAGDFVFGSIPWQLYVVIAVVILIYFMGVQGIAKGVGGVRR